MKESMSEEFVLRNPCPVDQSALGCHAVHSVSCPFNEAVEEDKKCVGAVCEDHWQLEFPKYAICELDQEGSKAN